MEIKVTTSGRVEQGLSQRPAALVCGRQTGSRELRAQITIPGVEVGLVIILDAREFLLNVKALFPEITTLDAKNLPGGNAQEAGGGNGQMPGGLPELRDPPRPNLVGMGSDPEATAKKFHDNQVASGKRFGAESSSSPAVPAAHDGLSGRATPGEVLLG